ncbi:E3 ubiquitin-protein ligase MIB2-like [Gigantopelta aegis]|uniref:E3 ubiquitin-protein ligase MIB2-like n=1 Tax=Gigantopelta aegis TaxID=1735272 RepID=UPI001B887737|nr:E3 ubiquitin-protein ligase MIB2-like [Gigantopelta aegis]
MILTSPVLDLTIENEKGFNPLHWAAFNGKSSSTLVEKILQRNKSLVNVRMEDGPTPLHIAAINDHTETAQILIKQGADVNVKDKDKESSPLHLACSHAYLGAAKILVAAGADVNMGDVDKNTPLHVVMRSSEVKVDLDEGLMGDLLKDLVKKTAGSTQSRVKLATFLLEQGADVNARNKDDKTPIDICTVKTLKKAVVNFKKESCKPTAASMNALLCSKCFIRTADVTLLPCNHKMTCRDCHARMSTCPLCGGEVTKAVDSDAVEIAEMPSLDLD